VEADEYDYSFLWLKPQIAIITNVDYDHPDLFPDQDAYDRAFLRFTLGIRPGGTLILNGDDAGVQRLLPQLQRADLQVVTYGERSGADWTIAGSIVRAPDGREVPLDLQVPGRHNIGNATASLIAMESLGVPVGEGAAALGTYTGVARRFEIKAEVGGVTIVDDYAHHPQEIAATIQAARSRYPDRRLIIAFQPHTYSRTKALASAFAEALTTADVPIVLDIYAARETDTLGVSAETILDLMPDQYALAGGRPADAVSRLVDIAQPGDVILTVGAGDVTLIGPQIANLLITRDEL